MSSSLCSLFPDAASSSSTVVLPFGLCSFPLFTRALFPFSSPLLSGSFLFSAVFLALAFSPTFSFRSLHLCFLFDAGYGAESSKGPLAEEDHEIAAKVTLLNHKISSNISAMPSALKRMNDCNSMMEKLDTYNVNIHPAFKRKGTR
ncbi:hypothetical protein IFM89_030616 [Coptis chinensis]|uniref:Uncharacterized protein n=1 Tax=Coptis chinensis TaxID=261450 RepID=A0A835HT34_9MAGN|nr:hypothetical protein IFM89_030616 [Coptis chinensis]